MFKREINNSVSFLSFTFYFLYLNFTVFDGTCEQQVLRVPWDFLKLKRRTRGASVMFVRGMFIFTLRSFPNQCPVFQYREYFAEILSVQRILHLIGWPHF